MPRRRNRCRWPSGCTRRTDGKHFEEAGDGQKEVGHGAGILSNFLFGPSHAEQLTSDQIRMCCFAAMDYAEQGAEPSGLDEKAQLAFENLRIGIDSTERNIGKPANAEGRTVPRAADPGKAAAVVNKM